ncbi:MAG: ABC transporter substrate-binding protein [Thermomicrobiales bacterium]
MTFHIDRERGAFSRRRVLHGGAALLLGVAGSRVSGASVAAADTVSGTIALDWYPNANHAGLYLVKERGYFAGAGLDLSLYTPSDPTTVLQTVGAGRDLFGISYQTDVLLARAQGIPVVSIAALVQHPLLALMSLKSKGIARPKDLVGKTVGYPGIPSQQAFLATMLETDGAKLDDIELINVDFNLIPAVISGRVDAVMGAYWTHETILAERKGYPVDVMRVERWGVPDYYELVLVASEESVAKKPAVIAAALGAIRHGYRDAAADPGAALATLAAASKEVDSEVERQGIALLIPEWTDPAGNYGAQSADRWTAYGAWMKARGLIPADLPVEAAYTSALLPGGAATPTAAGGLATPA